VLKIESEMGSRSRRKWERISNAFPARYPCRFHVGCATSSSQQRGAGEDNTRRLPHSHAPPAHLLLPNFLLVLWQPLSRSWRRYGSGARRATHAQSATMIVRESPKAKGQYEDALSNTKRDLTVAQRKRKRRIGPRNRRTRPS
jgi:hypothetical protein